MQKTHKEILTREQIELLPLLKLFSKDFGLVGGTAIAFHIGHRESIDFDLFTNKEFRNSDIRKKIQKNASIDGVIVDQSDEFTILVKGVKFTFLCFPYKIDFPQKFDGATKLPDLLTLAAMKAFALSRRAKWKDYIDLYFIMNSYYSIDKIIKKSKQIFGKEFNEKIFRTQLAYFKDIDHTEEIIYMKGFEIDDKIVKKRLIEFSLS